MQNSMGIEMTTQLTDHAKSILRAIADGKPICHKNYGNLDVDTAFSLIKNGLIENLIIAQETRSINGVTFAAPVDYGKGNYSIVMSAAGFRQRNFWFVKESDLEAAFNAILDALGGRTK